MKKKTLICIVGPTAIGKTSTSIALANAFKTEIISADSRQFFKEMSIGTAKPTPEELSMASHHFVDFLSIHDEYNAGTFERDALHKISELFEFNDLVILAGGSGLYVDAICKGLDDLPHDAELRQELNTRLENEGLETLQLELKKLDPIHYERMDSQNPQRLIRALEVCLLSGKTYSSLRANSSKERPFNILKIGLKADREVIYNRINQRVDIMINSGLEKEVKSLLEYKDLNALNTVGYKEFFPYLLKKNYTLEEVIEQIKMNTRRFAKRQMTWFKKDQSTIWFDHQETNEIIDYIRNYKSKASL